MPAFVFVLFVKAVIAAVRAFFSKAREVETEPLCARCLLAHVQYGADGRRAISCTYGGEMRLMKLDVLYCTDFQTRTPPVRRILGFVNEITPVK